MFSISTIGSKAMRRFKKILAVYGENIGADDVLSRTETLVRANNAEATLLEVIPLNQSATVNHLERTKRLERLARTLHDGQVTSKVVIGTPYVEVLEAVHRHGYDLVIVGADSGAAIRDRFFGNTAVELMRKCPCPVWVLKPAKAAKAARILACVNPAGGTVAKNSMDRKIMELSTSLAKMKGADLHIVHAWDVTGKDRDTIHSELHENDYKRILAEHEDVHRDRVLSLINDAAPPDTDFTLHLPRSEPHAAITTIVNQWDIELIVMGTICRTGIAGLLMGNAAEEVLRSVRCSVFTVKPEGFVGPVSVERQFAEA